MRRQSKTGNHQREIFMSELSDKFDATVNYVQTAEGDFKPSNDLQLQMYGLFKQATQGDVSGRKPGITNFVGRAKYSAWEAVRGMSTEDAMQAYIDAVEALKSEHG
jgi:diazepam-binding inhibitor (GABA receptor modulating acyl-CoA-binding protein)